MANVFGILTALVLALSAFIAYKNKGAYEEKITETGKQKSLLTSSEAKLATLKVELAALPAQISEVDTNVEKLTGTESLLQKSNVALKEANDLLDTKIAANKEKLDVVRSKIDKSGNLEDLAAKLRTTTGELEELAQSISKSEAKLANLTAEVSSSENQLVTAKTKFENFSSGQSLASLKTKIRMIYPNWGFVTLASGNNAGVMTNSTLNVTREGKTIAKLLVTAVETSTSSASIVPDSLGSDVTLMVGDRVEAEIKVAPSIPAISKAPVTTAEPVAPIFPEADPTLAPATEPTTPAAEPATTPAAPAAEADPFGN
jgi:peptidoglycan hydrolase CwlO-like protein